MATESAKNSRVLIAIFIGLVSGSLISRADPLMSTFVAIPVAGAVYLLISVGESVAHSRDIEFLNLRRFVSDIGYIWALITLGGAFGAILAWQLTRGTISSSYFMPVALSTVLIVVAGGLYLDNRGYLF
jgi:hypothetical protein